MIRSYTPDAPCEERAAGLPSPPSVLTGMGNVAFGVGGCNLITRYNTAFEKLMRAAATDPFATKGDLADLQSLYQNLNALNQVYEDVRSVGSSEQLMPLLRAPQHLDSWDHLKALADPCTWVTELLEAATPNFPGRSCLKRGFPELMASERALAEHRRLQQCSLSSWPGALADTPEVDSFGSPRWPGYGTEPVSRTRDILRDLERKAANRFGFSSAGFCDVAERYQGALDDLDECMRRMGVPAEMCAREASCLPSVLRTELLDAPLDYVGSVELVRQAIAWLIGKHLRAELACFFENRQRRVFESLAAADAEERPQRDLHQRLLEQLVAAGIGSRAPPTMESVNSFPLAGG